MRNEIYKFNSAGSLSGHAFTLEGIDGLRNKVRQIKSWSGISSGCNDIEQLGAVKPDEDSTGVSAADFDHNSDGVLSVMKTTKREATDWQEMPCHPRAFESKKANAGALMFTTHGSLECGCGVTGSGSLRHPIVPEYCPIHAAAPKMLEALRRIAMTDVASMGAESFALWAKRLSRRTVIRGAFKLRDLLGKNV